MGNIGEYLEEIRKSISDKDFKREEAAEIIGKAIGFPVQKEEIVFGKDKIEVRLHHLLKQTLKGEKKKIIKELARNKIFVNFIS